MSDHHSTSYQEDNSQGYAPGASSGYGDEAVYGDEGPAGYQEDVAYGDEGAYGDYGEQAYGDEGAAGIHYTRYDDDVAYGDEGADGEQAYEDGAYAPDPYAEEAEAFAPPKKKKKGKKKGAARGKGPAAAAAPRSKKGVALAAAGLALMVAMGGAAYFMFLAPSAEGEGGFDAGSLVAMLPHMPQLPSLPFFGASDTDETRAAGQANALAVKKAIDAFAQAQGRLPATVSEIESQLATTGWNLRDPYNPDAPLRVELAEAPSSPGAVAVQLKGKSYDMRVGDAGGKAMAQDGQDLVLSGRVPATTKPAAPVAMAPAAAAQPSAPAPAPARPADVAAVPAMPAEPAAVAPQRPPAAVPRVKTAQPPIVVPPVPTPSPRAAAPLSPAAQMRRNQEFDRWRNLGISLLYARRTPEAIAAFKKALSLRPGDETTINYLRAIQGALNTQAEENRKKYAEGGEGGQRYRVQQDVPPLPPLPEQKAQQQDDEAMRMLEQLKRERAPRLAPPQLED